MELNSARKYLFLFVVAILLLQVSYFGQTAQLGTVNGVVKDEHGAVVPGATISFERKVNGKRAKLKVVSESVGGYKVELSPGEYRIKVRFSGFRNFEHKMLMVEAGKTVSFDIVLIENPRRTSGITD